MAMPARKLQAAPSPRKPLTVVQAKPSGRRLTAPKLLARTRAAYKLRVHSLAGQLAPRFCAREFDGTRPEEEWPRGVHEYPFNLLEDLCASLPICRDDTSAKLVLVTSRYASKAARNYVESCMIHPDYGKTWRTLAGWCLARDVHDVALARGWARSKRERSDTPWRG